MSRPIVLFLTTPRCGTQWIASVLGRTYRDRATVRHEPIKYEYCPRLNLGNYDQPFRGDATAFVDHLSYLERTTTDRIYIETGWQTIAGVPHIVARFPGRVRLVHLVRHPVNVAASLVTHGWYSKASGERGLKAELVPSDPGASLPYYQESWQDLSTFEKCLYYWSEIHARAFQIEQRFHNAPFLRLRFEDLFLLGAATSEEALRRLTAFCDLEYQPELLRQSERRIDRYRYRTLEELDPGLVGRHPQALALGLLLGYDLDAPVDLARYRPAPRSWKNALRFVLARARTLLR